MTWLRFASVPSGRVPAPFFAFYGRPGSGCFPFYGQSSVSGQHDLVASGTSQSDGQGAGPSAPAIPQPSPRTGRVAIEVEAGQETTTVFIRGELDLVSMPVLAEYLTLAVRTQPGRLVLDMAASNFMDCGSARLIAEASRALPEGSRLVIRRPGRGVRRILELTGLDEQCEIET
jgi:anti-anti-sigma factor